ncbi:hypothetical protein FisN_18Lh280 [Fistulifera solaris]|uniref:Protein transport protein SEC23 n=1 Tax=Fistulifera solaris TaxID=1519565 RepID=A0A1Z5JUB3_FISSO|nr:hypothetical protein FisN_18Lh280 [Fistulifera solaris]|eukprot:GAX17623.1 hypothetical protein FisN_18Lh280 [Fistulifera solaris]
MTREFWNDSIRPVTARFPVNTQILDDSNLPFAVSLTPLPPTNHDITEEDEEPRYLTQILKCSQCGAPHPNRTTHFQLGSSSMILCYLCGRVSSSSDSYQQQQDKQSQASTSGQVFHLPLRISSSSSSPSSLYRVPAITCPPLWFFVLDGSCRNSHYWKATSCAILQVLEQAPSHVHISLLIAHTLVSPSSVNDNEEAENQSTHSNSLESIMKLSIYQLTSNVPYFIQMSSQADCTRSQQDLLQAVLNSCVPLSEYRAQMQTAMQSLEQYSATGTGFPLAWTTQVVLSALEENAVAAGRQARTASTPTAATPTTQGALPYCGAKLTCFLASRPSEWKWNSSSGNKRRDSAAYCLGGRVYGTLPLGSRFSVPDGMHSTEASGISPDEEGVPRDTTNGMQRTQHNAKWTPSALEEFGDWDQVYADLGKQCASASMGVDLLLCHETAECAVAIALLSNSGCPHGPVNIPIQPNGEVDCSFMTSHLHQIAPWKCVFGAELRVRLSPGLMVDSEPVVAPSKQHQPRPQLSSLYSQAGMIGPICPEEDSSQLWRMGVCDSHTNLAVDLTLEKSSVQQRMLVSGFGQVQLKPVLQTCFAYTTIVKDAATGEHSTVRRMRISSRRMPFANNVEDLYDSLDPEALAVVLFHKLVLSSMQDESEDYFTLGEQWLQSLLVCAYQSAEEQAILEKEQKKKNVETATDGYFHAAERLLDRVGGLSPKDVLLAQGHAKLALIPLMVFLLTQCDSLRSFPTHLDYRLQTLCQMSNMIPSVLARAIAPRLQLWESSPSVPSSNLGCLELEDEPIMDVMDLSSSAVQEAVMEYDQTSKRPLLLFLDAPDQILVLHAAHIVTTRSPKSAHISPALAVAIKDAASSYRVSPPIFYELTPPGKDTSPVLLRLVDVLMEDAPTTNGDDHFAKWRSRIAEAVERELSNGSN